MSSVSATSSQSHSHLISNCRLGPGPSVVPWSSRFKKLKFTAWESVRCHLGCCYPCPDLPSSNLVTLCLIPVLISSCRIGTLPCCYEFFFHYRRVEVGVGVGKYYLLSIYFVPVTLLTYYLILTASSWSFISFYSWGNWGAERSWDSLRVTQLMSAGTGVYVWVFWAPNCIFFPIYLSGSMVHP